MNKFTLFFASFLSFLLLLYLLFPGPKSITDFKYLPESAKSKLSGDTIQVPNIMAFFSNNYRDFVVSYYADDFQSRTRFFFPPMRLNYPPEFAFTAIKDQTMSTYLEELVYPLRNSLFVNGWEPLEKNGMPRYKGASHFGVEGVEYDTKVTLHYYPSSVIFRLIVWLGINVSVYFLLIISRKVGFNA